MIRVAIIDADVRYRTGLQVVLSRDPAVEIVGCFDNFRQQHSSALSADVSLVAESAYLDAAESELTPIPFIAMPRVRRRGPAVKIPSGCSAVVPRSAPIAELLIAIHLAARRRNT